MHRRETPAFERSLRQILASVLALPLGSLPACGGGPASSEARGDDASAPGTGAAAADASPEAGPPDPCAPVELDAAAYDDSGTQCALIVRLPCGLPASATLTSCSLDPVTCHDTCPVNLLYGCGLAGASCADGGAAPDADIVVDCVVCPGGAGRRPRGLLAGRRARGAPALGAYFAGLAYLEAASVTAFRDLERSLCAVGAPPSFRRQARRAADDERRHAATTGRLARRFGGATQRPRVARTGQPSLEEVLADNAVEGCVGESFGALVAMWQAARAVDAGVAQGMRGIARDEARHAALSWKLLRWGASRLDEPARRRLATRVERALGDLRATAERSVDPAVARVAGHPGPRAARALLDRFEALVRAEARSALQRRP